MTRQITQSIEWLMCCSSTQDDSLPSARRHGVFGYPKQSASVSVGSVLKWRARPRRHAEGKLSSWVMNNTILAFCFGISESTVFSNAIDSVSFGRWTGYECFRFGLLSILKVFLIYALNQWFVDDLLILSVVSFFRSRPAASLTWRVNGLEVHKQFFVK
jgi:hypothetical protein